MAIQLNVGIRSKVDAQLETMTESQLWAETWSQLSVEEQESFEQMELDGFASDDYLLQLGSPTSKKNNKTIENTSRIELVNQTTIEQTARNEWLFNTFLNPANILLQHKEAIASESFYEFDNKTKTIQRNDAWLTHLARSGLIDFEEAMDARANPVFDDSFQDKSLEGMAIDKVKASLAQNDNDKENDSSKKPETKKSSNSTKKTLPKRYVHLIPHSHTSEGFMSTAENYYTGAESNQIYIGGVRDILDSVISEMIDNKNLTFTYGEIKYFKQWYQEQSEDIQQEVKNLVKNGNLDLVSGGWSAPDEAITHYDSILDNFFIGQRFLEEEFGFHPQVSWQADAYGVSSSYARLAHDVGHNILMYSKADSAQLQSMRDNKTRVQVWRPHEENLGRSRQILTSLIHQNHNTSKKAYCFAQGFYVDVNYMMDAPLITNKNDTKYDFDKIVLAYYHQLYDQLAHERTNHIFSTFGCDFAFVDAKLNYAVITNLTKVWNELGFNDDIELIISTPTRYLRAMKELDKQMNPYNNQTSTKTNSTQNNSTKPVWEEQEIKSKRSSLAEVDKIDDTKLNKEKNDKDKEFGDDHIKDKKNVTNSTAPTESNFEEVFQNMSFAVNKTLAKGWPLRRDDGFPYQEQQGQFWNGYYTTRPNLKKRIREFAQLFSSTQRMTMSQIVRRDVDIETQKTILKNQFDIMELLGNLQHHEAISGQAGQRVIENFMEKAKQGKEIIDKQNVLLLSERLNQTHGIIINDMTPEIPFTETTSNLSSPFAHSNQTLLIVQNPSQQRRSELINLQLPYYNFTIQEFLNGELAEFKSFDKFLPRTWLNSNRTMVRSMVQFKVDFTDTHQVAKVFLIENKGVIRVKNRMPSWWKQKIQPWNLNLPIYLQKHPWDIYNFQSNFRRLQPKKDKIKAGKKILKFLGIKPIKKGSGRKVDDLLSQTAIEAQMFNEIQIQKGDFSNSTLPGLNTTDPVVNSFQQGLKPKTKREAGGQPAAAAATQSAGAQATSSSSSDASTPAGGAGGHGGAHDKKKTQEDQSPEKTLAQFPKDTEGAAIFEFIDEETGVSQKFAFSLRYYVGASSVKLKKQKKPKRNKKLLTKEEIQLDLEEEEREQKEEEEAKEKMEKIAKQNEKLMKGKEGKGKHGNSTIPFPLDGKTFAVKEAEKGIMRQDGMVEFSPESTHTGLQKSYRYGKVDMKKSQVRQNRDSGEYVIMWEQKYSQRSVGNDTAKVRASARISINDFDSFVSFQVTLNEVPIELDLTGKDIVADWYLLEDFKMDDKFWVDANGLQMVPKQLNYRRDYKFNSTQTIASNYYPITSAIAVRDHTNPGSRHQKQVLIMTENSHGASAGLRNGRNIEIMQMRRFKRFDSHGISEPLDEVGEDGKGIRNRATYHMHITNAAFMNDTEPLTVYKNHQREKQLRIDQPFVKYFSQDFQMPVVDDSGTMILANATNDLGAVAALHEKVEQANATEFKPPSTPNIAFKKSKTLKSIIYGIKPNEIQIRLTNLEDKFDGNYSNPIGININEWAREYYLEANGHLMVPDDITNMTKRNTSLDILEGVQLNITEMNLAGSIPIKILKDQSEGNRLAWFNWTTNIDENPPSDSDYEESADSEVSVPLPTNKTTKDSNATVALLNSTKSEDGKKEKADDSADMLGRKKGNFTNTNQAFSQFNETIHVAMLDPQQIRVFNIKFLVPGMNETNNATSLAKLQVEKAAPLNMTKPAADLDGDSKLGIGKHVKVATAEVKDVKKEEKKEEPKVKSFPKPDEPKKEEPKKEEQKPILPTQPNSEDKEQKDFAESLVKGLSTAPYSERKSLVQSREKEASEKDVVLGSKASEIPSQAKVQLAVADHNAEISNPEDESTTNSSSLD